MNRNIEADFDIGRIRHLIQKKKKVMIYYQYDIEYIIVDIADAKKQLGKNIPHDRKIELKYQLKWDAKKIKYLKKKIDVTRKELKIYEAEYKKKRKDPNYRIDFNLLAQKYNKYNVYM